MTRKGAIATYLEPWHNDIEDFIDLKKNSGEERRRAHDIFPALWITDVFMERVLEDREWTLFDPHVVSDLAVLYGDEFKVRYEYYEKELAGTDRCRVVKAKDLWKKILTSYYESGSPFLCFKDTANVANPNKHVGRIRSSNLCFTGDTIVATADGRNGVSIKQLAEESNGEIKFPVYCAAEDKTKAYKKVGNKTKGYNNITGWKDEIKPAVAFKTGTKKVITVVLENGDKFRCTHDHELALNSGGYVEAKDSLNKELKGFYTFTNSGPGSKYRHINSISNARKKQSIMMYEALKGPVIKCHHIDHNDNNSLNDKIDNLKQLSILDHLEKTRKERINDNPMLRKSSVEDENIKSINKSIEVTGVTNPNFSSLSNILLIELGKYINKILPGEFDIHKYNLLRDYYNLNVPKNFSSYRFGGSFETYKKYVTGELVYIEDKEEVKQYLDRIDFNNARLNYIYKHFLKAEKINNDGGDTIKNYRHSGLKVIEIIDNNEVEDVYDLTVDDNHNFYIITSTDDKNYYNCNGVLVHNCTEIFQNTEPNHYLVKISLGNDDDYIKVEEEDLVYLSDGTYKLGKKVSSLDTLQSGIYTGEISKQLLVKDKCKVYCIEKEKVDGKTAVCNLASVNLSRINTKQDMERVIPIAVNMLDNVIDLNFYPLKKVKKTNMTSRSIGCGVMGEAEMLASKQVLFGTQQHFDLIDEIMECFSYNVIKASSDLGKEKGNYPDFIGSNWNNGIMTYDFTRECVDELTTSSSKTNIYTEQEWNELRESCSNHMRNGYLMAIAPTSSISILVGTTQAIEPIYKKKWFEENLSGLIPVVAPNLSAETWGYYPTAFEVDQFAIIKAAAIRQKWIDQGQSTNIFMAIDKASGKYLHEIYTLAWKLGLKSTYYLRSQSADSKKAEEVMDRSIECSGCQ